MTTAAIVDNVLEQYEMRHPSSASDAQIKFERLDAGTSGPFHQYVTTVPCERDLGRVRERKNAFCYHITVPEYHREPSPKNASVRLAVLRITPGSEEVVGSREPVFVPMGGPGDPWTGTAEQLHELARYFKREFVTWDQRMVGFSRPRLECPPSPTSSDGRRLPDINETCLARFWEAGHDVRRYNTKENAGDMESIRLGLGYGRVVVYGYSYASMIAAEYVRMGKSNVVKALVLGGVTAPAVAPMYELSWTGLKGILNRVVGACRADETCHSAFPTLHRDVSQFHKVLDEEYGRKRRIQLGIKLRLLLKDSGRAVHNRVSLVPLYIHAVAHNHTDTLDQLVHHTTQLPPPYRRDVNGRSPEFYIVSRCFDYGALRNSDIHHAHVKDAPRWHRDWEIFVRGSFSNRQHTCAILGALDPHLSREVWLHEPPVADVPTLIVSGSFDAQTPPEIADLVAEHLPRAKRLRFDGVGHSSPAMLDPCGREALWNFFEDSSGYNTPPCMASIRPNLTSYVPEDLRISPSSDDELSMLELEGYNDNDDSDKDREDVEDLVKALDSRDL